MPHSERSNTACFLEEVLKYVDALKTRVADLESTLHNIRTGKTLINTGGVVSAQLQLQQQDLGPQLGGRINKSEQQLQQAQQQSQIHFPLVGMGGGQQLDHLNLPTQHQQIVQQLAQHGAGGVPLSLYAHGQQHHHSLASAPQAGPGQFNYGQMHSQQHLLQHHLIHQQQQHEAAILALREEQQQQTAAILAVHQAARQSNQLSDLASTLGLKGFSSSMLTTGPSQNGQGLLVGGGRQQGQHPLQLGQQQPHQLHHQQPQQQRGAELSGLDALAMLANQAQQQQQLQRMGPPVQGQGLPMVDLGAQMLQTTPPQQQQQLTMHGEFLPTMVVAAHPSTNTIVPLLTPEGKQEEEQQQIPTPLPAQADPPPAVAAVDTQQQQQQQGASPPPSNQD